MKHYIYQDLSTKDYYEKPWDDAHWINFDPEDDDFTIEWYYDLLADGDWFYVEDWEDKGEVEDGCHKYTYTRVDRDTDEEEIRIVICKDVTEEWLERHADED